jgi:diguanylate cyclase (GGDEF)-like protein
VVAHEDQQPRQRPDRPPGPKGNAGATWGEHGETASDIDQAAADRVSAAADRDDAAADRDRSQAEADQRTSNRRQAATGRESDRRFAAADRELAAADRAAATHDREHARAELRHAQLDQLTGAFGRELGMVSLEHEINRARHGNGRLVLAYIDVDGLKQVNDRQGHAAGDALLRDVVDAIQAHLRSYDPIVRVGGDEFVCALGDSTLEEARRRFHEIRATMEQIQPTASFSAGFAALRPEDTLEQLTQRGDTALYETKRAR